ncbi:MULTISPECIES: hypothetical protein [unclassified Achromobacter]|uniref:hypothetical protein n=1 Tax=unclassified Achromobacter TaxID=2626865 RepID=UPI0018E938B3|nr:MULTISPECIES: hypothetical protein [unclassified Achromobacter]
MKLPPIADRISPPTPEEVRNARLSAGLTQTQAAQLVCGDGAHVYRVWNQYEVPVEQVVHRPIPLAMWELFLLSIGHHPRLKLTRKQLTSFRDKDKRAFATPVHAPIARPPVPSGERGKECVLAKYPRAFCVREEGNFGVGKDRVRYAVMASPESSQILGYGKREAWAWTQANRNLSKEK